MTFKPGVTYFLKLTHTGILVDEVMVGRYIGEFVPGEYVFNIDLEMSVVLIPENIAAYREANELDFILYEID